jgi:DNA primase
LKESPTAIDYLKHRGLTGAIAAHFGIGYAPDAWQPLAAAFDRYDNAALETAGLVITGEGGKRYDRFRDRIMFPIHDARGQVIGFGGRVLGDGEPKYLNSPETPLFSKGRELYGLFLARGAIRNAGTVVVVEGYMDVVALAQHGVEYAVATLGTSTTPTHVQKLFRQSDRVVFCFDGDSAGRKAAWRALENALPVLADGKNAAFLFLPEGEDPDDFVRKRGKAAFEALLERALPASEFLVAELSAQHPPTSVEGRAALVNAARPYLAQITAPVLAALLRRHLAALSGLPEAELRPLLQQGPTSRGAESGRNDEPGWRRSARSPKLPQRRAPSLVRELIQGLLLQPELGRSMSLPQPADGTPEGEALAALVAYLADCEHSLTTASVMQHFADSAHDPVFTSALAAADDHRITAELAAERLTAGVARYWQQARRAGLTGGPGTDEPTSPEETERLRQLEMARRGMPGVEPGVTGRRS